MICFPNCKLNIGLYVTNKRPDGYHNLETIFYPIQLTDVLEIVPAATTSLKLSGLPVSGDLTTNLIWKAYELVKNTYPVRVPAISIFLHKVVPMGAGLGGGSADGAFMLRLLNDHCQLNLSNEELATLALHLGSDCPFFIYNTPVFATGRGETFTPVKLDLSAYDIQLVYPHVHIATSAAFKHIVPCAAPIDLRTICKLPITEWKNIIYNDFEKQVFKDHPEIASIKTQLYAQGALYAAMSGSGSSVYGIMPKGQKAIIAIDTPFDDRIINGKAASSN